MERACTSNLCIDKQIFSLPNTSLQVSLNSKAVLPQWEEISDFCELKSIANVKKSPPSRGTIRSFIYFADRKTDMATPLRSNSLHGKMGVGGRQKQVV